MFELTNKLTWDVRLQVASIPAHVYQMRRPDANQLFEDPSAQRRPTVLDILKLLVIYRIADVGKTPEKTVYVMTAQQFADRNHVDP